MAPTSTDLAFLNALRRQGFVDTAALEAAWTDYTASTSRPGSFAGLLAAEGLIDGAWIDVLAQSPVAPGARVDADQADVDSVIDLRLESGRHDAIDREFDIAARAVASVHDASGVWAPLSSASPDDGPHVYSPSGDARAASRHDVANDALPSADGAVRASDVRESESPAATVTQVAPTAPPTLVNSPADGEAPSDRGTRGASGASGYSGNAPEADADADAREPGIATSQTDPHSAQTVAELPRAHAPQRRTAPAPVNLDTVARYRVKGSLGRGGMGEVMVVHDAELNRDVALKILLRDNTALPVQTEKFLVEAQVTGQLEHPNIVPVYELGQSTDGRLYFTMKRVRGRSLRSILDALAHGDPAAIEEYPQTRLLDIFLRVCDGVAFAHSRGVVHRDLKPDNVMVGEFGEVMVMDWGLARITGVRGADSNRAPAADGIRAAGDTVRNSRPSPGRLTNTSAYATHRPPTGIVRIDFAIGELARRVRADKDTGDPVTRTVDGTVMGTPAYMAPEQARGDMGAITPLTDIYALGAMLYHIVTYKPPIEAESPLQAVMAALRGELEPPSTRAPERKVVDRLEAIVMRALATDPGGRYQCVADLQEAVRTYLESRSVTVIYTRRIRPGAEAAFEAWINGIIAVASQFRGYQGVSIIRARDPADPEYVLIIRFADHEWMRRWHDSPERAEWIAKAAQYAADESGAPYMQADSGRQTWFDLRRAP